METDRLLLAAAVRKIAITLQDRAADHARKVSTNPDIQAMAFDAHRRRYAQEHPLTEFVPAAVQELRDIAALLP